LPDVLADPVHADANIKMVMTRPDAHWSKHQFLRAKCRAFNPGATDLCRSVDTDERLMSEARFLASCAQVYDTKRFECNLFAFFGKFSINLR
jgi:hypothetical protein